MSGSLSVSAWLQDANTRFKDALVLNEKVAADSLVPLGGDTAQEAEENEPYKFKYEARTQLEEVLLKELTAFATDGCSKEAREGGSLSWVGHSHSHLSRVYARRCAAKLSRWSKQD